jgi:hypothetical protein
MSFPEDLAEKATRSLVRLGVQVKCGLLVQDVDSDGLIVKVTPRCCQRPRSGKLVSHHRPNKPDFKSRTTGSGGSAIKRLRASRVLRSENCRSDCHLITGDHVDVISASRA